MATRDVQCGGQDPSEGGVNQRAGSYWFGLPGGLIIQHLPTTANHLRYGIATVNVLKLGVLG